MWTIAEVCERTGLSARTVRYYEELGLMRPASRTSGGIRYYRDGDLNRLRRINELGGYLHLVMSIPGLAAH